jgi:hypothetical protein
MIAVERAKLTESNIEWLKKHTYYSHSESDYFMYVNCYAIDLFVHGSLGSKSHLTNSGDEFCNAIADDLKIKRPYEDKMTELEQLKKRVEQLEKQIGTKSTEKPMERWKPKKGETYSFINSYGQISRDSNYDVSNDKNRIKFGNAFPEEMKDYLESDHVKLLQFHLEMAGNLWQIDRENMGEDGAWWFEACRYEINLKQRIARQYSFPTKETASLAWLMLSDEIKEWLTT